MAVMNPCCCSLQTGTVVVAIFHMCMSSIFLIYRLILVIFGIGIASIASFDSKLSGSSNSIYDYGKSRHDEDGATSLSAIAMAWTVLSIILITFLVANIIFSIILLIGANQRNVSKCRAWLMMTSAFLAFYILHEIATTLMVMAVAGVLAGLVGLLFQLVFFLIFVFGTGYELFVVYAFVDELKRLGGGRPDESGAYPGVVYSAPPKPEDERFLPHVDFGSPPPPYAPTTYTPTHTGYNPSSVGYPVLPVGKET